MGTHAERVAIKDQVSREDQDAFALASHQKAIAAIDAGRFDAEMAPVTIRDAKGRETVVIEDAVAAEIAAEPLVSAPADDVEPVAIFDLPTEPLDLAAVAEALDAEAAIESPVEVIETIEVVETIEVIEHLDVVEIIETVDVVETVETPDDHVSEQPIAAVDDRAAREAHLHVATEPITIVDAAMLDALDGIDDLALEPPAPVPARRSNPFGRLGRKRAGRPAGPAEHLETKPIQLTDTELDLGFQAPAWREDD